MAGRQEAYRGTPQDGLLPLFSQASKNEPRASAQDGENSLEAKVQVATTDRFNLMVISNVNYGTRFFDEETFEKHTQMLALLENTKVILLGPLISNRPATDEEWVVDQHKYMKDWIDRHDAEGKILAAVRSPYPKRPRPKISRNEEGEEEDDGAYEELLLPTDPNEYLFENVSFSVLENGGILTVGLVPPTEKKRRGKQSADPEEQLYRIALYSKSGASRVDSNKNAAIKRAYLQKVAGNADIAILGNPYVSDVTQTIVGHPPTRQELTLVTDGGYLGNATGEHPELTDRATRDSYGLDGEPSGQVITLFRRTKETRVYLQPEHFVYDYFVDAVNQRLDGISQAGKEADFHRSLSNKGIKLSESERQIIFQNQDAVNKLLQEQHHPERRRS